MSAKANGPDATTPKGNGLSEQPEVLDAVLVDEPRVNPLTMPVYVCVTAIMTFLGFLSLVYLYFAWPPRMAVSLKGGVQLVYEILDKDASVPEVIDTLDRRINPSGIGNVIIRPHNGDAIEVIVGELPAAELVVAKKLISTNGMLDFQIVANQLDHGILWNCADDPRRVDQNLVRDENGDVIGRWVRLSLDPTAGEEPVYRVDPQAAKTRLVGDRKEILMVTSEYDVQGTDLASIRLGFRGTAPCVFFDMSSPGARKMAALTGGNLPDISSGHYQLLGIIMDHELISAPRINEAISDSGIIEGQFTREEVDLLVNVLRTGQLPAPLAETPYVEQHFPPDPASQNVMRRIIMIGLTCLLIFWGTLLVRYKLMGALAVLAGFVQPLLALALIVFVGATVSVPVAGIVMAIALLVSLSNVVVCESIRRSVKTQKPAIITLALNGLVAAACLVPSTVVYPLARSDARLYVVVLMLAAISAAILQLLWLVPALAGLSYRTHGS